MGPGLCPPGPQHSGAHCSPRAREGGRAPAELDCRWAVQGRQAPGTFFTGPTAYVTFS